MVWIDTVIVVVMLSFFGLIVWSRVMNQSMTETIREIKEIVKEIIPGKND